MAIKRWHAVPGLLLLGGLLVAGTLMASNRSYPEFAGRWTVARMENVSSAMRTYIWEGIDITIDARGLLYAEGDLSMVILDRDCGEGCVTLSDNYFPSSRYTLVRSAEGERLDLRPDRDALLVLQRQK